MKKIILAVLLSITFLVVSVTSQAADFDPNKWGRWAMYYYFHKDAKSVPDFIDAFDKSGILVKRKGRIEAPLSGGLSQIFAQNPDKIKKWLTPDLSLEMKEIAVVALLLEGLDSYAPNSLEASIQKHKENTTTQISNITPSTPADLDLMWGALFASENPVFFHKIVSVLDDKGSPTGNKMNDTILRGAAKWSLGSNMRQHVLVERLVQNKIKNTKGSIKKALDEIWAKFGEDKKGLRFQEYDGDFSAGLNIADPNVIEELKKPSDQGLNVKIVKEAKRGDDAIFHLIFSGMELSENYNANVTYDAQVLAPNGDVYFEDENLNAMVTRSPKRFSVFTSRDMLGIHFDPDDLFGTYRVIITITDNISKKTLKFEQNIELIE